MSERIQKFLSGLGYGSRREVEDWITDGRLVVNGEPATVGQKITEADAVKLDGKRLSLKAGNEPMRVLLYKKRTGEMVTRDDPEGRRTVFRKLPELETGRWIAVGRLDVNTSGLLLMTNHGELARRLMHPSFEQRREYAVRALGEVSEDTFANLRKGVTLEDGEASFESIRFGDNEVDDDEGDGEGGNSRANKWFIVTISEGRHREVRRLFESQGLTVNRLIRTAYGPIKLGGGIKSGSFREATADELKKLIEAVNLDPKEMLPERVRESHRTKSDYSFNKPPKEGDAEPSAPIATKRGDSKTAHRAAAALAKSKRRDGGSAWVKATRDERKLVDRQERRNSRTGGGSEAPTYVVKPPRAGSDSPWGKTRVAAVEPVESVHGDDADAPQQFKAKGFGAKPQRSYQERGDHAPAAPQRSYRRESGEERRPYAPRTGEDRVRPSKPYGERKSFGDKPAYGSGARKPYGDSPRRDDGDRPRYNRDGAGDAKPRFNARPDKPSVSKPYVRKDGTRPTFAARGDDRPSFKPRSPAGGDRKPYGDRSAAPRSSKPTQRFVVKDGAATRPGKPEMALRKKKEESED